MKDSASRIYQTECEKVPGHEEHLMAAARVFGFLKITYPIAYQRHKQRALVAFWNMEVRYASGRSRS